MLKNGSFKGELNLWVKKNWGAGILFMHAYHKDRGRDLNTHLQINRKYVKMHNMKKTYRQP